MIVIDIFRLPTGSAAYQTNVLIFLRQLLSGTIGYEGYLNRTWEAAGWEVLGRESKISLLRLNKLILVVPTTTTTITTTPTATAAATNNNNNHCCCSCYHFYYCYYSTSATYDYYCYYYYYY